MGVQFRRVVTQNKFTKLGKKGCALNDAYHLSVPSRATDVPSTALSYDIPKSFLSAK
jgi:hypothetical protein